MEEAVMREIFILGTARTPIGSFQGALADIPAPRLAAAALAAALTRSKGVSHELVGEVIMGNVLAAGLGQAPARQAAHYAGLPRSVGATSVNKMCGSGLKSVVLGTQAIANRDAEIIVAGGMESMSGAPYLLPKAREGLRMGHAQVLDSMIHDGLWDVYGNVHMGDCGELCAREKGISRQAQDAYAAESYRRALRAQSEGRFKDEITPIEIASKKGPPRVVSQDEEPARGDIEKLASLRPAFQKEGTITAGNASSLSDGAAAVVLASSDIAGKIGAKPRARIVGASDHAQAPEWFTTAPASSIERLLAKVGWRKEEVDLFEINEAFSVVAIANNQLLGLDPARVNIWGGAVALGHPIGASGTRVLVTLLSALEATGGRRGIASLCIGGGEAIAIAIERL
jgi:acetyl-CoA C-acetyltransferase